MYAHELFKSFHTPDWQKSLYSQLVEGYFDFFRQTLQAVNDAQKFHMGKQSEVNHAAGGEHTFESVFTECHFPYDNCWFDYVSDVRVDSPATKRFGAITGQVRSGLLCCVLEEGLYTVNHYTALTGPDSWTMDPVTTFVGNRPLDQFATLAQALPKDKADGGYVLTSIMPTTPQGRNAVLGMQDELIYNAGSDISTLAKFLRLLNCRNSVFEEVTPKNKPLKKRNEKRKPGTFLYRYKLLRLDLGKERGGIVSLPRIKHLWQNPLHSCRGHFKTYTPERRLFGKYIGTFWFPPHMRGNATVGVVDKEYVAVTRQEEHDRKK